MKFKNTNLGSTRGRLVDSQWKSASISTFPAALPDKVSPGEGGEKKKHGRGSWKRNEVSVACTRGKV